MASTAEALEPFAQRFALRFTLIDGHLTAYRVLGDPAAPKVLLLHGLGAQGSTYAEVAQRLADGFQVILPDLLGSGQSAKPRMAYTPDRMAANVTGLLRELGVEQLRAVVGHSQGAAVAVEVCHQLGRVERLVLLNPPPVRGMRWLRGVTAWSADGPTELFSAFLPHRRLAKLWLGFLYSDGSRLTDEVLEAYAASSGQRGYAAATAQALASLARLDLHLEAAPGTLLLWGADDRLFPPRLARGWRKRLARSELTLLPATGHCPHEERPDAVAFALRAFLAARRASPTT